MILLKENKKHPNLDCRKNEKLVCRGYYSTYTRDITSTFNVWNAFSSIFIDNKYWFFFKEYFKNIETQERESETEITCTR